MVRASFAVLVVASLGCGGASCGGEDVDCEKLCKHTLACEVSFAPSDDVDGKKVKSGERTDLESCTLGCEENPRVTVESASCVDEVEVTTAEECQDDVLACFGAAEGEGETPGE